METVRDNVPYVNLQGLEETKSESERSFRVVPHDQHRCAWKARRDAERVGGGSGGEADERKKQAAWKRMRWLYSRPRMPPGSDVFDSQVSKEQKQFPA